MEFPPKLCVLKVWNGRHSQSLGLFENLPVSVLLISFKEIKENLGKGMLIERACAHTRTHSHARTHTYTHLPSYLLLLTQQISHSSRLQ